MQVTFTTETSLNSVALVGVMPRFTASIPDDTRACTEAQPVIGVVVVSKILPWPLLRLLISRAPTLVPTTLHTALFIVKVVLLLGRPFHVYRDVVRVLIRGVVSYRHLFLKP